MNKIKFIVLVVLSVMMLNSCFALCSASQAGTGKYCGIRKCPKE